LPLTLYLKIGLDIELAGQEAVRLPLPDSKFTNVQMDGKVQFRRLMFFFFLFWALQIFYMQTAATIFSEALTQAFQSLSRLDSSCVDVQLCLHVFAEADSF
jgi:hypothetical protein